MIRKGIHLYSGGLDSMLSAKLLINQGIDLIGLNFILPFTPASSDAENSVEARRARDIGLNLRFIRCGMDYMKMAQNPPHGYGSHMNPCIDCKIFFMRKAAEIMKEEGASFVSTGEVTGQRPMSQTRDMMKHILKESGLAGRLLRPLCALKLTPTLAEEEGVVDRTKLLDISGRGRYRQIELASAWGIKDFAAPAGGCLFTDSNVSQRIKDLYKYHPDYNLDDIYFLSFARHFRINESAKFIVARDEKESDCLEKYRQDADLFVWPDFAGPCIFVKGYVSDEEIPFLVSVISRYGKIGKNGSDLVFAQRKNSEVSQTYKAENSADDIILESMRI